MIDLHCHILPGVDDGSPDLKTSLDLAQVAYEQGITKMLLTPHHMDGEYVNHKDDVLKKTADFQKELYTHNIPIELRAGQEVHINGNLLDALDNDDVLFADQNKKYLMLELPHNEVPEYTDDMIFELQIRGIVPIIVHPERNYGFQSDPDKLYDLIRTGCLSQITANSYIGGFGKHIQKFSDKIINANLSHVFSSDAHNLHGRNFRMQQAFNHLEKAKNIKFSENYENHAELIWQGKSIENNSFNRIKKDSQIKKILKGIFKIE